MHCKIEKKSILQLTFQINKMKNQTKKTTAKKIARHIINDYLGMRTSSVYTVDLWDHATSVSWFQKYYYTQTIGRRGYRHYEDNDNPKQAYQSLDVDFEQGNDAPKGGQTGNYILVKTAGKRRLNAISKYFLDKNFIQAIQESVNEKLNQMQEAKTYRPFWWDRNKK